MTETNSGKTARRRLGLIALALLVLTADRLSKAAATRLTAPVTLWPGLVRLVCVENTGVAFSMLAGAPWLGACVTLAIVLAGFLVLRRYRLGGLSRIGAALVTAGAVGNLIDRLLRGAVVDMIELTFVRFAVFNVADMAVCVGCGLLAISLLARPQEWTRREVKADG